MPWALRKGLEYECWSTVWGVAERHRRRLPAAGGGGCGRRRRRARVRAARPRPARKGARRKGARRPIALALPPCLPARCGLSRCVLGETSAGQGRGPECRARARARWGGSVGRAHRVDHGAAGAGEELDQLRSPAAPVEEAFAHSQQPEALLQLAHCEAAGCTRGGIVGLCFKLALCGPAQYLRGRSAFFIPCTLPLSRVLKEYLRMSPRRVFGTGNALARCHQALGSGNVEKIRIFPRPTLIQSILMPWQKFSGFCIYSRPRLLE